MKAPSHKAIIAASFAFLLLVVTAVVFIALMKDSDLPVYEGKNADEWFYGEQGHPGLADTINAAKVAFSNMGTNSVPYLINKIHSADSTLSKAYYELYLKIPDEIRKLLPVEVKGIYKKQIALSYLKGLPIENLDPFVIELMELYPAYKSQGSSDGYFDLIKSISKRTQHWDYKKNFFKTMLDDPDNTVRLEAAIYLSKIDRKATNGIPILLNSITNSFVSITVDTDSTRPRNRYEMFQRQRQREAHEALSRIAPELAEQYPLEAPQP
ncbi:MAG: hypothetical protein ACFHW5_11755 [Verrucomicrobiota bacterium]